MIMHLFAPATVRGGAGRGCFAEDCCGEATRRRILAMSLGTFVADSAQLLVTTLFRSGSHHSGSGRGRSTYLLGIHSFIAFANHAPLYSAFASRGAGVQRCGPHDRHAVFFFFHLIPTTVRSVESSQRRDQRPPPRVHSVCGPGPLHGGRETAARDFLRAGDRLRPPAAVPARPAAYLPREPGVHLPPEGKPADRGEHEAAGGGSGEHAARDRGLFRSRHAAEVPARPETLRGGRGPRAGTAERPEHPT
mmetsp:Transcript_10556/g.25739  ORF Transcript_10556/g.25739 Transcript_10556/m.25739 type:complete len:249 (-) Transcript_10556:388-1134(-)